MTNADAHSVKLAESLAPLSKGGRSQADGKV